MPLELGEEHDLGEIALEPAPVVRVTVVDDASGEAVEGARVLLGLERDANALRDLLSNPDGDGWGNTRLRFALSDADGGAVLPAIVGSMCQLVATFGHLSTS